MANRYSKAKLEVEKVVSLYQDGMTQKEVGEELGFTQKVIFRVLKENGIKCRPPIPRNPKGYLNSNWKGNKVTYAAFHYRIQELRGRPKFCEVCETTDPKKSYDWANLSGKYDDPSDYKRMCRSCHWKYDKKYLNFKGAGRGRKAIHDNSN
jgi:hypothetical protein